LTDREDEEAESSMDVEIVHEADEEEPEEGNEI